jgi:hypothetical protein
MGWIACQSEHSHPMGQELKTTGSPRSRAVPNSITRPLRDRKKAIGNCRAGVCKGDCDLSSTSHPMVFELYLTRHPNR